MFWQAPETLEDIGSADSRSDVWSLGCLLFELISGKPPFYEETNGNLNQLHQMHVERKQPQIPKRTSVECEEFLNSCLKYDANERSTIMELKQHPFLCFAVDDTFEEFPNPALRTGPGLESPNMMFPVSTKNVARTLTGNKSVWNTQSFKDFDHGCEEASINRQKAKSEETIKLNSEMLSKALPSNLHDSINPANLSINDAKITTELDGLLVGSPAKRNTESPSKRSAGKVFEPAMIQQHPAKQDLVLEPEDIQQEMDRLLAEMIKEAGKAPKETNPEEMSLDEILKEQEKLLHEMMNAPPEPVPCIAIAPETCMKQEPEPSIAEKDSDDSSSGDSESEVPKIDVSGFRARVNSSSSQQNSMLPFALLRKSSNLAPRKLTKKAVTPLDSRMAQASIRSSQHKKFIFAQPAPQSDVKNTSAIANQTQNGVDRRASAFQPGSLNLFSPVVIRRGSQGGQSGQEVPNTDVLSNAAPESPGKTHTTFGASAKTRKQSSEKMAAKSESTPLVDCEVIEEYSAKSSKRTVPNNSFGIMKQTAIMNSGLKSRIHKEHMEIKTPGQPGNFFISDGSKTAREMPVTAKPKQLNRTSSQALVGLDVLKKMSDLQGANHLQRTVTASEFNSGSSKIRDQLKRFNFTHGQDNSAGSGVLESSNKDKNTAGSKFQSGVKPTLAAFFNPQNSFKELKEMGGVSHRQPPAVGSLTKTGTFTPRAGGEERTPKLIRKKLSSQALQSSKNTLPQLKTQSSDSSEENQTPANPKPPQPPRVIPSPQRK